MNFRNVITKLPATNMSVKASKGGKSGYYFLLNTILFENQIQTASVSPCRTQIQSAASFLVCSLIFIEDKKKNLIGFENLY